MKTTMKLFAVAFCVITFFNGVNAKTTSLGNEDEKERVISHAHLIDDFDPDGPKYGQDSATCVRNLSLYREYFRQRNFESAIDPWRWVFFNCPLSSQNIYLNGVVMMKTFFNQVQTAEKKEAYVDSLIMIYDQRIKAFGREGFVLGRKGVDKFNMSPLRLEEAYKTLEKSIEIEQNATGADVVVAFFQSALRLSEREDYTNEIVIDAYVIVNDIINYNLRYNVADTHFVAARHNIDLLFDDIANCPDLVNIYSQKLEEKPDDRDLLERISSMLNKYGCQDEALFFQATEKLHAIEPTAQSAFLMGNMLLSKKEFRKAADYFLQAVNLYSEEEVDEKADALLQLAEIYFRNLNQLSRARTYARQAFDLRPNDGRPLLLIGDMYANSASQCGDNEFEKKTAYWAAVDKFIQARNIDISESVQNAAQQRIASWSQYFPNDELIFFHGYEKGQSYKIECWINRTTTVR